MPRIRVLTVPLPAGQTIIVKTLYRRSPVVKRSFYYWELTPYKNFDFIFRINLGVRSNKQDIIYSLISRDFDKEK